MRIDFIRHGACCDDAFLRGRSHSILSSVGQQQMQAVFSSIALPELVITSSASRCLKASNDYYCSQEEPLVAESWDQFQERDFGVWDGLSYEAICALDPEGLQAYLSNPFDYEIAEAESLKAFESRIKMTFKQLLHQMTAETLNHVVVVTHGGVMRILLKHVLQLENDALFQLEMGFGARMTLECFAMNSVECQLVNASDGQPDYFIKLLELVQNPLLVQRSH